MENRIKQHRRGDRAICRVNLNPPMFHLVGKLESIICKQHTTVYGNDLSLQAGLTDSMLAAFPRASCSWPELVQITPSGP